MPVTSYLSEAPEAECVRSADRTARKPHRCDVCRGTIQTGERYTVYTAKVEGRWERSRQHRSNCWES